MRNLFDARVFGQRAERSLADPGVANYVSTLVADAVIKSRPDLIAVRPILRPARAVLFPLGHFRFWLARRPGGLTKRHSQKVGGA